MYVYGQGYDGVSNDADELVQQIIKNKFLKSLYVHFSGY